MKLGLTGGIASGKSTVSAMFVQEGALLVDADRIAREVVLPGSPALAQIAERFGSDMLLSDGSLDRKRLGERIFKDDSERRALDAITHPIIRQRMKAIIDQYEKEQPDRLIIADIPLLYESNLESQYDGVIVVYVAREVQMERLMKRDGLTEHQAMDRLNSQMDIERKRESADFVIHNDKGLEETHQQVLQLMQRLRHERASL